MRLFPVVALSALVIGPALGQGVIQKCVDREGDITYQDTTCERGSTSIAHIARDTRQADPAALQRAREEQERADRAMDRRARLALAEAELRSRQPLPGAGGPLLMPEPYSAEPYYVYAGGAPGAVKRSRGATHSSGHDNARTHRGSSARIVGRPLSHSSSSSAPSRK